MSGRETAARRLIGRALRRYAPRADAAPSRALDDAQTAAPEPGQPKARRQDTGSPRRASRPTRTKPTRTKPTRTRPARRPDGGPGVADARADFFRVLERSGDLGSAAAATVRAHLRSRASARARSFAQILQQQGGAVRQIGDIALAITAVVGELPATAWRLFSGADQGEVVRLAPAEYLRTAFHADPDAAAAALSALLGDERPTDADAAAWLDIAQTSLVAGVEDLSRAALDRAVAAIPADDTPGADRLRYDASWLRGWYGRRGVAGPPAGSPSVAVFSYRAPDRAVASRNLGDYLESLAVLSQLARRPDVELRGGSALDPVLAELKPSATAGAHRENGAAQSVAVCAVDRDASSWSNAPDGTWLFVTGRLPEQLFATFTDLPFDDRFRPIFLSVHVESTRTLTPSVVEYLRRHGPVGCRDHSTVLLLQAAGVPAFFAGAVTAALSLPGVDGSREGTLAIDAGGAEDVSQDATQLRRRGPGENLGAALEHARLIAAAAGVSTSRLQSYLAATAVGTPVDFTPANPAQRRLWGLRGLSPGSAEEMRERISGLLDTVLGAVAAGDEPDAVREAWRSACVAEVQRAEAVRRNVKPLPAPAFDVAAACATIRSNSTTIERTAPVGDGDEINVEFSLDGNYKHQLEVVLDSIVVNTSRPVRAFVLCREHTPADYERMTALFPEVSFRWLPTDDVDYGPIRLLANTTVATMDRLLLPELLPEISRIVHHDLDALCLADLAELHDIELGGTPLAARMSPQQNHVSGYASLLRRSEEFTRNPKRAHEFLLRTHSRLPFDYNILNAGIMTLDLDAMRADDFCRNFLPYAERFGLNDQAVLNIYVGPNRAEIDPGWNWRPWLEWLPAPKIAHWAGEFKPWKETWVVGRDLWRAAEARVDARYDRADLAR